MQQQGFAEQNNHFLRKLVLHKERVRAVYRVLVAMAGLVFLTFAGCSLARSKADQGIEQVSHEIEDTETREPNRIGAMLDRLRGATDSEKVKERTRHARLFSGKGQSELQRANEVASNGSLKHAIRDYKRIARHYGESSVGEEAQFRLAEGLFALSRLAEAQDAHHQLLEDYPSTRYMDKSTRRLFSIARYWLGDLPLSRSGDGQIQLVSHSDEADVDVASAKTPNRLDPTLAVPVLPNFHDRTRPMFDTKGRALEALRTIWLSDPTGPLADDALMVTATHYLNKGDYVESDRYFKILRDEYPKSPHLEDAFVLGSHVKLMSYQGSMYDGTTLDEAQELKKNTLRLFPNTEDSNRIREELAKVEEASARRDWDQVEFYRRKGKPRAMAIYCLEVIRNHPQSKFADQARATLRKLDPKVVGSLPGLSAALPRAKEG